MRTSVSMAAMGVLSLSLVSHASAVQAPPKDQLRLAKIIDAFADVVAMNWPDVRASVIKRAWPEPLTKIADDAVIGTGGCVSDRGGYCASFAFGVLGALAGPPSDWALDVVRLQLDFESESEAKRFAESIWEVATRG